jgi:DNA repair photolyase
MSDINCILLYGNDTIPTNKNAGPFRIATELRNNGYTVQTIDLTAFDGFDADLELILNNIISEKTLWLGISTTFLYNIFGFPYNFTPEDKEKKLKHNPLLDSDLKRFVSWVREKSPNIRLISGGTRQYFLEDYGFTIFHFYSDKEIVDFTKDCETWRLPAAELPDNQHIHGSEFQDFVNSQIIYDPNDIIFAGEALSIEISRGCIFKCKFCGFPLNGKTKGEWIKNSHTLKEELIRNYEIFGTTDYIFSDDTYNDSDYKVKLLYDEVYNKLPFQINFATYIRLDLMLRYRDMIDYLAESGLVSCQFGIETINPDSAKVIGKGVDPRIQFEFIKELKQNRWKNILTSSGIIVGLPQERENEFALLEEFIFSDQNYLDHIDMHALHIFPPVEKISKQRTWSSVFDIEYQKYGYECYVDESGFVKWKNSQTRMNFDLADNFATTMNERIKNCEKFRFGGFGFILLKSLGINAVDLRNLSMRQIKEKYNIKYLINNVKKNYRTSLINLSKKHLLQIGE